MPKGEKRERLICTIWPGEHSMSICTQQHRRTWSETLRVSRCSPVNGLPGYGNRGVLIISLPVELSTSGYSSNNKERTKSGSSLPILPFMICDMTLPIAHASPAGRWRRLPSTRDIRRRMAHLLLPPRYDIPCRVAHNSKSESSSCKAKLKEEQNMVKVVV